MHVLLVAPEFPVNQRQFARALREAGARVTGIGERPYDWLDPELRSWLHGYEQVPSVCHEESMIQAVRRIQGRGWVDRIEATVEAHILPTASVREATGIPGLTVEAAVLCRDKPAMKEFLRKKGIPCARSTAASSEAEVREFAKEVGYPLILKPRASAGAEGTFRIDDERELQGVLRECGVLDGHSVAVEEFIEGHEGFYDTLSIDGSPAYEFISHYFPGVLVAMRNRWISPQLATTNRMDAEGYTELKVLGRRVIQALGLGTTATHMEWFYGPKGLKFSEIGARPPGVRVWDIYGAANDVDMYRSWAMALAHGKLDQRLSRRFSGGMIALRPDRDGRISGYSGVQEMEERLGPWLMDAHLPSPGTPTQPVEAGFMANAWVRLRHPDYDELRRMMDFIGQTVHVYARA
jgi:carbamoylphosphate synthase large subunit